MDIISFHKKAQWFKKKGIPFLPQIIQKLNFLMFNSHIPIEVEFKEGTYLSNGGMAVAIHGDAKIGKYVIIGQRVTIGGTAGSIGLPVIGDEVLIAPGVVILGGVKVGSNVIIGANAVVMKDIPNNSCAVGIPARVLKKLPENYVMDTYFSEK